MNEQSVNDPNPSTEAPDASRETQSSGQPPSQDIQSVNKTDPSSKQSGASEKGGPKQYLHQYWICEHDEHGRWFKFGNIGPNKFFRHDPHFWMNIPSTGRKTGVTKLFSVKDKDFVKLKRKINLAKYAINTPDTLAIVQRFNDDCPNEEDMPNYEAPQS